MSEHRPLTEATGVKVYFADPPSPRQQGINENTNGLLRRYPPKAAGALNRSMQRGHEERSLVCQSRASGGIGISNHLFPDGRRYSHPEKKSIAGDRALFGEDSPLSMRIQPLNRPGLPHLYAH